MPELATGIDELLVALASGDRGCALLVVDANGLA